MLAAIALWVVTSAVAPLPPSDAEVLRALPPTTRGLPFVVGEFRDDVVIVKSLLAVKELKPGLRNVVESHWECAAYYTRTVQLGFPFEATVKKPCVSVVYIDTHTLKLDAGK